MTDRNTNGKVLICDRSWYFGPQVVQGYVSVFLLIMKVQIVNIRLLQHCNCGIVRVVLWEYCVLTCLSGFGRQ